MNRRIALFGSSLALDSIGTLLAAVPGLELVAVRGASAEVALALQPSAIFFDMAVGLPSGALLQFMSCPQVTLVGLDLGHRRMTVLSGKRSELLTMDDLLAALEPAGEEH
jgi:hypothetical protein